MIFSPRMAEVLLSLAHNAPAPAALSGVPEPVLWLNLLFSPRHDEPENSSSMVEHLSGNFRTQETRDDAVHHANDALRQWTHDEQHGYHADPRTAHAGSGFLEFSGVKCP